MARIRMITPGFFDDPDIGDLSLAARLFFIGLWTQADREGRLADDMRRLKVRIFPFDDAIDAEALAVELTGKDLIRRYVGEDGHAYIWIRTFAKHQRPHPNETKSVIPPYAGDGLPAREKVIRARVKDVLCKSESGVRSLEYGVRNLEICAEADDGSTPAVLVFPTVGTDGTGWGLSEAQIAEWVALFPTIDVLGEARKALAWVLANPGHRKTARGMPRFLVGWLSRTTNRGGQGGSVGKTSGNVAAAARFIARGHTA